MYSGKERVAHFRHDQQSLFDEHLIDQHQGGDEPDPFDHRQIRIVHGGERQARDLLDGDYVGSTATNDGYDLDDSRVNLLVTNERSPVEEIVLPVKSPTRISPLRRPHPVGDPLPMSTRGRDADAFSWRGFAAGAAVGSLAAVAALVVISVAV